MQQLEWKYRVVILPNKASDIEKVTATRGEWIPTPGGAQCLAIAQTAEHASFEMSLPIHFELFFDPDSDSVRARNRGRVVIEFEPVCPPNTPDTPDKVFLQPYLTATITSGSWRVSAKSDSYRILISPRRYTLHLLGCRPAQEVVGTKRRRDVEEVAQDAGENQIIRHLGSVTELSSGQKVMLDATTSSYQLVDLKNVANTRASKVFQARHSDYPGQIVIVKVMKRDTREMMSITCTGAAASAKIVWPGALDCLACIRDSISPSENAFVASELPPGDGRDLSSRRRSAWPSEKGFVDSV